MEVPSKEQLDRSLIIRDDESPQQALSRIVRHLQSKLEAFGLAGVLQETSEGWLFDPTALEGEKEGEK